MEIINFINAYLQRGENGALLAEGLNFLYPC